MGSLVLTAAEPSDATAPRQFILRLDPTVIRDGSFIVRIGRYHQINWFEEILRADAECIVSRLHCEISWRMLNSCVVAPTLHVVGSFPMCVDSNFIPKGASVLLQNHS